MQKTLWILVVVGAMMGCAHVQPSARPARHTLGYLQLKTPYATAAWAEGKMAGVHKALTNLHSRTGKPYPCWNALKPFRGRNLPVSLRLAEPHDARLQDIVRLARLPADKLNTVGGDGHFSVAAPSSKSGYTVWRLDQTYQQLRRTFQRPVVGVVDLSASMKARDKAQTILGLKDANVQFEKLYAFSSPRTLREISLADIVLQKPRGQTAIFDNLQRVFDENPGKEIMLITDGKDTISTVNLAALQSQASTTHTVLHLVLTGQRIDESIVPLAQATGGSVMRDLHGTGAVLEPVVDAVKVE